MTYQLDQAKILVIDDMSPILELIKNVLSLFGFKQIYLADNGKDAFNLLCKHDPDLVITDWHMGPVDGLEFTKMVRRNPLSPNPYVPILMMTGYSSRLRVENARDKGITEFLVKPFSSKDLYTRVVQIIEKPRQFVDAEGFFGPDRRRKKVRDYQGVRRRNEEDTQTTPPTAQQKITSDILKKLREEAKNASKESKA